MTNDQLENLLSSIITDLEQHKDRKRAEADKRYHKYDGYISYGLTSPTLIKILKKYNKVIKELESSKALDLADRFYKSRIEEQLLTGNFILGTRNESLVLPQHAQYLDELSDHFISWSTVDDFCIDVLQPLLLRQPQETIKILRQWNKSASPWKRRASVVVFTRKIGESGKFTKEVIEFCENLKNSSEDLVQKGVGWALKDAMRGDKKTLVSYIKKLRQEGAPATITLYAMRDLKGREREELLEV